MIQIDMDKPKDCIWADITNHIYYCPLLNEYHKCNLQDYEPRTIEEQYVHCPLHEADPDTVSRQQAIDAAIKAVDEWDGGFNFTRAIIIKKALNALPPSPTPSRQAEPQWIPVSERLPELDVNINVYTKENPIMVSEPVCISYKLNGRDYVCPIPCILHSNGHWYIDNNSLEDWVNLDDYDSGIEDPLRLQVTAWMPEPEPYKGGGV